MSKLKQQLYLLCADYIKNKEAGIRALISEAQEAANEETKSSAGDKYETGREVMQQEIDLNLTRLNELNKLKQTLERIPQDNDSPTVIPGSVVHTTQGNYYIAIGAGQVKVDGTAYFAISASSPIGTKLSGLRKGDSFEWNGKKFVIETVN